MQVFWTNCKHSQQLRAQLSSAQAGSYLVILLADQPVHEGEVGALELVPAHRALGQHKVRSDGIMSHLQPAHLHAIFMEIFSAGEQAVSDNDLGADTADFTTAILAGTLGADKLVVHCDNLAMDDGLTEGTPTEQSIRRRRWLRRPHLTQSM